MKTSKQRYREAHMCRHTHTHTQHKCVPFLLARSSFRGLSKNMASEEDAFERQKTKTKNKVALKLQISSGSKHGFGWAQSGPTKGPCRPQHNPQEPACYCAQRP